MFGLSIWEKTLWAYDIGDERETAANMRCLPMSGSVSGTPCLIEKAWICVSLDRDEAQSCNRQMHFPRMLYGVGFFGTQVDVENVGWGLWR